MPVAAMGALPTTMLRIGGGSPLLDPAVMVSFRETGLLLRNAMCQSLDRCACVCVRVRVCGLNSIRLRDAVSSGQWGTEDPIDSLRFAMRKNGLIDLYRGCAVNECLGGNKSSLGLGLVLFPFFFLFLSLNCAGDASIWWFRCREGRSRVYSCFALFDSQ